MPGNQLRLNSGMLAPAGQHPGLYGRCFITSALWNGLIAEYPEEKELPWIRVPAVSVDPKLGNSVGVLAGYIFKIDPESTTKLELNTIPPGKLIQLFSQGLPH